MSLQTTQRRARRYNSALFVIGAAIVLHILVFMTQLAPEMATSSHLLQDLGGIFSSPPITPSSCLSCYNPRTLYAPDIVNKHLQNSDIGGLFRIRHDRRLPNEHPVESKKKKKRFRSHDSKDKFYYEDVGPHRDSVCELRQWQKAYDPVCNLIHEFDLDDGVNGLYARTKNEYNKEMNNLNSFLDNGDYRDVWVIKENLGGTKRVMKTLRYSADVGPRYLQMFRDEAAGMAHVTASPYVVSTYGMCGVSSLMDYSSVGGFKPIIRRNKLTSREKLKISSQVARGIADLHDFDNEGRPSIAVADVSNGQFIYNEGLKIYQIHDLNLLKMISIDTKTNTSCLFSEASSAGSVRSPEEYWNSKHTEKIDVWAVGNVIHAILCGGYAFLTGSKDVDSKDIRDYVKAGRKPPSFAEVERGGDDIELSLLGLIKRIRRRDAKKRPTMKQVRESLDEMLLRFTGSLDVNVDAVAIAKRPKKKFQWTKKP